MWTARCRDEGETRALGARLGALRPRGLVVAMIGPLGAGKTAFAQGVGGALGIGHEVTSPTFVLLSEHDSEPPLLHADLYRLEPGEQDAIGLEELLEGWPGLALVEWADRFPEVLPVDHLEVRLAPTPGAGGERDVEVRPTGPAAAAVAAAWARSGESR